MKNKVSKKDVEFIKGFFLSRANLIKISRYGELFGVKHFYNKLHSLKDGHGTIELFNAKDVEKLKNSINLFTKKDKFII
jgi:hypothetical protein